MITLLLVLSFAAFSASTLLLLRKPTTSAPISFLFLAYLHVIFGIGFLFRGLYRHWSWGEGYGWAGQVQLTTTTHIYIFAICLTLLLFSYIRLRFGAQLDQGWSIPLRKFSRYEILLTAILIVIYVVGIAVGTFRIDQSVALPFRLNGIIEITTTVLLPLYIAVRLSHIRMGFWATLAIIEFYSILNISTSGSKSTAILPLVVIFSLTLVYRRLNVSIVLAAMVVGITLYTVLNPFYFRAAIESGIADPTSEVTEDNSEVGDDFVELAEQPPAIIEPTAELAEQPPAIIEPTAELAEQTPAIIEPTAELAEQPPAIIEPTAELAAVVTDSLELVKGSARLLKISAGQGILTDLGNAPTGALLSLRNFSHRLTSIIPMQFAIDNSSATSFKFTTDVNGHYNQELLNSLPGTSEATGHFGFFMFAFGNHLLGFIIGISILGLFFTVFIVIDNYSSGTNSRQTVLLGLVVAIMTLSVLLDGNYEKSSSYLQLGFGFIIVWIGSGYLLARPGPSPRTVLVSAIGIIDRRINERKAGAKRS
jgi:hypothetical protein